MALRLQYFPIRGFGEYIRTLLIDNQIEFVDEKILFEEWPAKKETMPFGQMPLLIEDGNRIPQSGAILRHLARTHGLYGSNEDEHTFLDVLYEALRDMRSKFVAMVTKDFENLKDEFNRVTYPQELAKIEKLLKTYESGEKLILGDKISFVDYVLFEELELSLASNSANLDIVPLLKGYHERFQQRPNLKEHFAKRSIEKPKFGGSQKI